MRPQSIGFAAAALLTGGMIGLGFDLTLASATFALWCTAWTWGPLVTSAALLSGVVLLNSGQGPFGRLLGYFGALGLLTDVINLDVVGFVCGVLALANLQANDSTDWALKRWKPPFPAELEPGATGIVLTTSFLQLGFLLFGCVTRLTVDDTEVHRLPWGRAAIPLTPGPHTLKCEVPYLIGPIHPAKLEIEVPAEGFLPVDYHAPGWIVFLPGTLRARAR